MSISSRVRALCAAALVLVLSSCASLPPQQSFNKQASQGIKTIAVLQMRETEPGVFIMNNPGASFGLIGALISETDLAAKRKKLRAQLAAAGVDYVAVFKNEFTLAMGRRGYALVWPEAIIETTKSARTNNSIRKSYGVVANADAQLDVNFGFIGYAAAGATKNAPYRPTGTVVAQLVTADGKSKLFTDTIIYHNVFNVQGAITMAPDESYSYPNFSDVEKAGPDAAKGIKVAAEALADKLADQL
jgi:hypothetical protein